MIDWWKSIKVEHKYINRGLNEAVAGCIILMGVFSYLVYSRLAY